MNATVMDTRADAEIQNVLSALDQALQARDLDAVLDLFAEDCYWRDLVAFTWNLKTVEGKPEIRDMLEHRLTDTSPGGWAVDEPEFAARADGVTEGFIRFDTATAHGYGHIRIRDGLIWTLLTTMEQLNGYEEPGGHSRPFGAKHDEHQGDPTWAEERDTELAELGVTTQPHVLIVGGGQSGIALGARLRQHGVPALIVDRNARAGDAWRNRYKTLCLHDPIWYDHLPYIKFPDNWPVFTPKDKMGDWLEMYTQVMELNYWASTEAKSASYDERTQTWTVVVERDGRQITLEPSQLVMATGAFSHPHIPGISGQDRFAGVQQHSSEHQGPDGMEDKRVVVVGSNNSSHDICAALATRGIDVTMVQRSATHVARSSSLMKHVLHPLYSEEAVANGITTEKADLITASIPYALLAGFQKPAVDAMREDDREFYQALEDAGFMLHFGADDSGLFLLALRRAGGYYIDVGASRMIIDGRIKLASGSDIHELTENSVVLEDGRELPADVIVYATGYGSMNQWAAELISREVADKVGKVWGLGSDTPKDPGPWEGELRNMWKPTQQPGLWFHSGNLAWARFYSHFLALQLKARMEGLATPVYGLPATHHRS